MELIPGQRVRVVEGEYRGRIGVAVGSIDGTGSILVALDHRSKYDAERPKVWPLIPLKFLIKICGGENGICN